MVQLAHKDGIMQLAHKDRLGDHLNGKLMCLPLVPLLLEDRKIFLCTR